MPGLVLGIHVFGAHAARKTWMAGASPAMTKIIKAGGAGRYFAVFKINFLTAFANPSF